MEINNHNEQNIFLSLYTTLPPREVYVQVVCSLLPSTKHVEIKKRTDKNVKRTCTEVKNWLKTGFVELVHLLQSSGSFHAPSVALEWAATTSSATTASTGCTRNAVGSSP